MDAGRTSPLWFLAATASSSWSQRPAWWCSRHGFVTTRLQVKRLLTAVVTTNLMAQNEL